MRARSEETGQVGVFSPDLLDAIRARLDRAEQTILFLNRRGYSTSLICHECGFVSVCDHCSVSLTYHRHDECLRCHICGDMRSVPERCPECLDPTFKYAGVGTQRVETIIGKCFPQARVERLDADTTTRKDAYRRVLGDFRSGKIDILIGTQMIAKGLHFPNVTLVGIVYADLSLHLPDFRAGERTFQLLAQVAGRAGRGDVSGEVIVQTYTPFNAAVQHARRLDYDGFADEELEFRRELAYPPFTHLLAIHLSGKADEKVMFCAGKLQACVVRHAPETVVVSDACPAPIARAKGRFRHQILMRSRSAAAMSRAVRAALAEFALPRDVRCSVDVDALSLL
jgi:primosomal protein N' (replication factor Y)